MSTPEHRVHYSIGEYLAFEASSNVKHEYHDGQIYAMAGGTPEHAALAAAVVGQLYAQLRDTRCRVYNADLRVRIPATGLLTYPDATVVCGPRQRDAEDPHALTNPMLVVEVLSRGTEEYDRGDKFEHYKRSSSLHQSVLVSHRERAVEVWTRGASDRSDEWTCAVAREGQTARLDSIGATLDVAELYRALIEPTQLPH
jgi:Uma2 family endonuclease